MYYFYTATHDMLAVKCKRKKMRKVSKKSKIWTHYENVVQVRLGSLITGFGGSFCGSSTHTHTQVLGPD